MYINLAPITRYQHMDQFDRQWCARGLGSQHAARDLSTEADPKHLSAHETLGAMAIGAYRDEGPESAVKVLIAYRTGHDLSAIAWEKPLFTEAVFREAAARVLSRGDEGSLIKAEQDRILADL